MVIPFCGQDACRIDPNGRVKLTPRFLADFMDVSSLDVILHCLPEGAMAIYSHDAWRQMRSREPRPAERAGNSIVFRREQRRFGSFSQPTTITNQGRITIPPLFRDALELTPGTEAVLVGVEIGVELWNDKRWAREAENIQQHQRQRAELEMNRDLDNLASGDVQT